MDRCAWISARHPIVGALFGAPRLGAVERGQVSFEHDLVPTNEENRPARPTRANEGEPMRWCLIGAALVGSRSPSEGKDRYKSLARSSRAASARLRASLHRRRCAQIRLPRVHNGRGDGRAEIEGSGVQAA